MSSVHPWLVLALLLFVMLMPQRSDGAFEQRLYCIADEQTPDDVLIQAMNWACGQVDVDCSKIKKNGICYFPNTVRDHSSYVFNEYYQKYKQRGGTCYFRAAAITTEVDPSHGSCKFGFIP